MNSLKKPLALTTFLFIALVILGHLLGGELGHLWKELEEFFGGFSDYDSLSLTILIFLNNSIVSLSAILLGTVFVVFPILVSTDSGLVTGLASFCAAENRDRYFFS